MRTKTVARLRSSVLSRRALLRGAAATVALPALEAMLNGSGTALADGRPLPKRLGIFFWGNGVRLKQWVPAEQGRRWALSEELAPLAAVQPYINVVTGTAVKTGNEWVHHAGTVGILSGAPMVSQPHPTSAYSSTFSAPSLDQVAAEVIGRTTPFRSLEVGVSRLMTDNEGTTLLYMSHRGPDNANPPEFDPERVFDRLFGAAGRLGTGEHSALAAERAAGRSVLDVVAEDAKSLHRRLGTSDRRRMEQHVQNIREIEKRITGSWRRPAQCGVGEAPWPAAPREHDGKEPLVDMNEAMSRLVALALSCDLTRVFTFMFSGSVGGTVYWQVGQDKPHHKITHDEPGEQPLVHAATVFVMQNLARLLETLAETPDGAGNLLDHSAILATTDCSQGKGHSLDDYPILLAGRASGALRYPGVHYRSGKQENASKVLLSLLRSVGVRLPRFGNKGGEVKAGLSAIEA